MSNITLQIMLLPIKTQLNTFIYSKPESNQGLKILKFRYLRIQPRAIMLPIMALDTAQSLFKPFPCN